MNKPVEKIQILFNLPTELADITASLSFYMEQNGYFPFVREIKPKDLNENRLKEIFYNELPHSVPLVKIALLRGRQTLEIVPMQGVEYRDFFEFLYSYKETPITREQELHQRTARRLNPR